MILYRCFIISAQDRLSTFLKMNIYATIKSNRNMNMVRKIIIFILVILTSFLSLTGIIGGVALVAGVNAPPVEELTGSIFKDFTIPGIALTLFVGGSALLAAILLFRKNVFALLFAYLTGIIIMSFEFIEILIIGSPEGIARNLQIFYFGIGTIISVLSIIVGSTDLLERKVNL